MNRQVASRGLALAAAAVAVLCASGCSTLFGIAAHGSRGSREVLRPTIGGANGPRATPTVASIYEVSHFGTALGPVQGRPHSIAMSLARHPAYDAGCSPVPIGLQELMYMPNGVPAAALRRVGPFEFGVQGPAAEAVARGDAGLLASGAALGTSMLLGGNGCVGSLFYVSIGNRASTPFSISR